MAIEAAGARVEQLRVEQLLARHPDMPSELEQLLRALATSCAKLERANAELVQSVAAVPDEDLHAVRRRGIERRWAEYGGLELWQDSRPAGRHSLEL